MFSSFSCKYKVNFLPLFSKVFIRLSAVVKYICSKRAYERPKDNEKQSFKKV